LVPHSSLLVKTAALRAADALGRVEAHQRGVEKLAELAGAVLAGRLDHHEWELRKSAGIFNKAWNWGASALKPAVKPIQGAAKAATKAPGALAGMGRSLATFGKVAPWVAGAGLTYGLMKGVPWAARQLEHSSSQTMAPSMGWSPIEYGYGSTPWGPGQASMGYGG
jgi:hypothetical protein